MLDRPGWCSPLTSLSTAWVLRLLLSRGIPSSSFLSWPDFPFSSCTIWSAWVFPLLQLYTRQILPLKVSTWPMSLQPEAAAFQSSSPGHSQIHTNRLEDSGAACTSPNPLCNKRHSFRMRVFSTDGYHPRVSKMSAPGFFDAITSKVTPCCTSSSLLASS